MRVEVRVIADRSNLLYVFAGDLPEGFEAFGKPAGGGEFYDAVFVRGAKGERMPLLAAEDWLRDRGVEPERVGEGWDARDRVVNKVCAQRTWAELKAAMDGGYVPTCRGRTKAERAFVALLKAEGYRVWGDKGRMW